MTTKPELFTVRQVADTLGLSVSTIWRQLANGAFPKPIKIGGSTRWRRADIEAIFATDAA